MTNTGKPWVHIKANDEEEQLLGSTLPRLFFRENKRTKRKEKNIIKKIKEKEKGKRKKETPAPPSVLRILALVLSLD
jgi:hypothetical protein